MGLARALRTFLRLNALLASAVRFVVVAQVGVMVCSILWQVFTRAAFSRSPPWTEEVALLAFAWVVLLMAALCVREHLHVRISALPASLPPLASRLLEGAIALLVCAIGAYMLWAGTDYALQMRGSTSSAIRYPMELLYVAMPVASLLMLLFALENAITGRAPSAAPSADAPACPAEPARPGGAAA